MQLSFSPHLTTLCRFPQICVILTTLSFPDIIMVVKMHVALPGLTYESLIIKKESIIHIELESKIIISCIKRTYFRLPMIQ